MNYNELLQNFRQLCKLKLDSSNCEEKNKFYLISNILSDDDCFKKIDMKVAVNILLDLGYTKQKALEEYSKILDLILL